MHDSTTPSPVSGYDVVIVGAGHGGAYTAIALRAAGFVGSIALIGEEPELPYERPPLSKAYLSGEKSFDRILIRPATFWQERRISLMSGRRVCRVDPHAKTVEAEDGALVGYGTLVWATGGRPARLSCSGHDLAGVHTVRTRADVDGILAELPGASSVVVVGGGYVGLEAAAALTKLGRSVTVLEAQDRVLARVAGEPLSRFFEAEHFAHGVNIRLNTMVECLEEAGNRVGGVRLRGGEVLPCDLVIVGIGIRPAIEPLTEAGAADRNGLLVDEHCRTSLAQVYALGDCCVQASRFADHAPVRLESVQNAQDQATTVAKAIVGRPEPHTAVPWFWSDQYDIKLKTIGLSAGHDELVMRGDPRSRAFSVVYLRDGRVVALDCVNSTRDYVQGRALVEAGARIERALLADVDRPLKTLLDRPGV